MEGTAMGLSPRGSVAIAILGALEGEPRPAHAPEIEDISVLLYKLLEANIDIGDVNLRRVPGGFYSEDVETLVGHYLGSGYAQKMSPVRFTEKGLRLLRKIIADEKSVNPDVVRAAARVLGLNL
jgi:hypothetical protein